MFIQQGFCILLADLKLGHIMIDDQLHLHQDNISCLPRLAILTGMV